MNLEGKRKGCFSQSWPAALLIVILGITAVSSYSINAAERESKARSPYIPSKPVCRSAS